MSMVRQLECLVSNATTAIANGYARMATRRHQAITTAPAVISVTNDIVTGFPSWTAWPSGGRFRRDFSQELGNRLQFGIDIKGGTNLYPFRNVIQRPFTDPGQHARFCLRGGFLQLQRSYVGIIYGPGGTILHHQRPGDATGQ